MVNDKIKSFDELKKIVRELKREGKAVVFANGVFDILHVGHVRYFKGAKELGDVLIVAVNDDLSTERLKGKGRPIMPVEERLEILSEIMHVDYLVSFPEDDVSKLLLKLKPHYHAKGTDYTLNTIPEREVVLSYSGKLAITGDPKSHSSSGLLGRCPVRGGD